VSGVIYVVQAEHGGPVKIGWTSSGETLPKRLSILQTGSYRRLRIVHNEPGSLADEKALHREFKKHRISGEWFWNHHAVCGRFPHAVSSTDDTTVEERMYDTGFHDGWERGYDDGVGGEPDEEREAKIQRHLEACRYLALHGSTYGMRAA
jgi:hypothetical protein